MKRRLVAMLLALCMVLTWIPVFASAAEIVASGTCGAEGDNLTWTLDSEGLLTISGTGAMYDFPPSAMPGWDTEAITSVYISPGVTTIGNWAFYGCKNMSSITIPEGVTYIGNRTLSDCSKLASIYLPDSLITIGDYTFDGCNSVKEFHLPASLEYIGTQAFGVCDSLTGIWVDEGNDFFTNDTKGMLYSKDMTTLIRVPSTIETGVVIPSGVTTIAHNAFVRCFDMSFVTFPDTLTYIGYNAFLSCESLTSITFPDSLTIIDDNAFALCTSLSEINFPATMEAIEYSTFNGCAALKTITLPEGITRISGRLFEDCKALEEVNIPDSVTVVGEYAFYDCSALEEITLPDGLTSIEDGAFINCGMLSDIVIPAGVINIGHHAFSGCSSLKTVTLSENLKSLGQRAFGDCKNLNTVTIPASVTDVGYRAFSNCSNLDTIHFLGDAPYFDLDVFIWCDTTVYYPADNDTWTEEVMQDYGGNITWVAAEGKSVQEELKDLVKEDASAEEILDAVQQIDTEELKTAMEADLNNSGAVADIAALEVAAGGGANVVTEDEFQGFEAGEVSVVGANLNKAASDGEITLVIGAPEADHTVSEDYDDSVAIYFSMDLANVEDPENLKVPVKISFPIPDTFEPELFCIVHYHDNGTTDIIWPAVYMESDRYIASFVLTSFSDFAMTQLKPGATVPMYRLYNPNSGEHFYTGSIEERFDLVQFGWQYEGVAWNAPITGEPVYRAYNPNSGDHHYTMDEAEKDWLVSLGWQYEGVAWNTAAADNIPQYRLWNPNADLGSHHYTSSTQERDYLVSLGWVFEGIGWYGMLK